MISGQHVVFKVTVTFLHQLVASYSSKSDTYNEGLSVMSVIYQRQLTTLVCSIL